MTTSPGYQSEEWKPLDPTGRTWETKVNSSLPTPGARPVQDKIRSKEDLSDDLAVEAGYSRPGRLTPTPPEPRTSSNPGNAIPKRAASPKSTDERVIDHPTKGPSRHSPPIIKEQHVWGVADEWGGKAGKWGQGSKAHQGGDRKPGDGESK
jgi:protein AFG1